MTHKHFSFLAWMWFASTMICLATEGSGLGAAETTVINDLSAFTTLKIGGLVPIPAPNLYFFRGVFRMLLMDYSFFVGGWEVLRYFWLCVFSGAAVWGISKTFAPVFANFLRIR